MDKMQGINQRAGWRPRCDFNAAVFHYSIFFSNYSLCRAPLMGFYFYM